MVAGGLPAAAAGIIKTQAGEHGPGQGWHQTGFPETAVNEITPCFICPVNAAAALSDCQIPSLRGRATRSQARKSQVIFGVALGPRGSFGDQAWASDLVSYFHCAASFVMAVRE